MKTFALLFALASTAYAGSRMSANYSIVADTVDDAGRRTTSAVYTNDGSAGEVAGLASVVSPAVLDKIGYIGQLVEVQGFALAAKSATLNENSSQQLIAGMMLDDATLDAFDPSLVSWSVVDGPISSVTANGLAVTGAVFQDSPATVQGVFEGATSSLSLTVVNTDLDNFGSYAGDGIDDAWQNQFFGLDNPNAGPNVDVDGTGQTNLFKYTAGLNPLDPNSRFSVIVGALPGQPAQRSITFAPLLPDRVYTVTYTTSLVSPVWTSIPGAVFVDHGQQRTVTDPAAAGAQRFYRVEVSKP